MSSEQQHRTGVARIDKSAAGFPEQYVIVGLDISAHDLKARYKGTKRHKYISDVVDGAVQLQRTKGPPSAAFTRLLRKAKQIPAIYVCDLGRDASKECTEEGPDGEMVPCGRNHVLVIDGRQRNMATRINNVARAKEDGEPRRKLDCMYVTFPSAGTYDAVVAFKVGANVREIRTPSSRAEDATDMMRDKGWSMEDIAPYVEVATADEVNLLLALHLCTDEVKDAVDRGKIPLAAVARLSMLAPIKQVAVVARKLAPSRKAADDAAPPRPKARSAKLGVALAREMGALGINGETHALARWFAGDDGALVEHPRLVKALESAKGAT